MGVIHKLREEVVQFILEQKKMAPSIGCRQLAQLVSGKFETPISKSAVNNVLQNAQLSSPVGRRMGLKSADEQPLKPRRFEIPTDKKQQLLENFKKLENPLIEYQPTHDVILVDKPSSPPIVEPTENLKQEAPEIIPTATINVIDRAKDFVQEVYSDLGIKDFWIKLGKKYFADPLPENFEDICQNLFYSKLQKLSGVSATQPGGCEVPAIHISPEALLTWNKKEIPKNFVEEYFFEKQFLFLEAQGFELELEDATRLIFDVNLQQVFVDRIPEGFVRRSQERISLENFLINLSKYIVSNSKPLVFLGDADIKEIPDGVCQFVAFCEKVEGKKPLRLMVRVQEQGVVEFKSIPWKKRTFILAVHPQQKEFEEILKVAKWGSKKNIYVSGLNRNLRYSQTRFDTSVDPRLAKLSGDLGVITIWEETGTDPYIALLTNENLSEEIIENHLLCWLNFQKTSEKNEFRSFSSIAQKNAGDFFKQPIVWEDLWEDLVCDFGRYCA